MERVVPCRPGEWQNRDSYLIYLRHLAAYHFARSLAEGRRVLDLGCGAGYGTAIMAQSAKEVIALDVALSALAEGKRTWKISDTPFMVGDGVWLPLRDGAVDLVVSFQVIEHIRDETCYLKEIGRVLAPGGIFIVSTPNKALRLLPFQPPFNPYHVREYDYRSLRNALRSQFSQVDVRGLHATPEIAAIERERLKQNPAKVYARLIASRVLPPVIQKGIRNTGKGLFGERRSQATPEVSPSAASSSFVEDDYSADDYWVGTEGVQDSLDLIAICNKH